MRRLALLTIWLLFSLLPIAVRAAEGSTEVEFPPSVRRGAGPGRRPAASSLPARTIMLEVRGLDIDHVLKLLGDAAGLTIVKDPAVTGPVTIIAPRPVSIEEALDILNSVLQVRGFTSIREGQVLKITTLDRAVTLATETHLGRDPESVTPGDRIITQIVPLANLDAADVAVQLGPLAMRPDSVIPNMTTNTLYITDTASNVKRLLGIINEMEARNAEGVRIFRLQYVGAEEMAELLSGVLTGVSGGTSAPYERRLLPRRGSSRPRATGGGGAAAAAAAAAASAGRQILTDTRTNSVIVIASPERLEMAEKLIAEFDQPVDYSSTLAVIPLQHTRASDMADLLSQAFGGATSVRPTPLSGRTSAATPRTTSASRAGSNPEAGQAGDDSGTVMTAGRQEEDGALFTQADENLFPGRSAEGRVVPVIDASDITVIADPSTNSLIVNAAPEKLELVKAMVKNLDIVPTQVLIQAIIAEVLLSERTELGLEFIDVSHNIFGTGAEGTLEQNFGIQQTDSEGNLLPLLGLSWAVIKPDRFEGIINTLATDSNVKILSTPKIFTTSGKSATIDISTQVPFATGQFVSDIGGGVSTTFEYQSVGIVLEVVPTVSQDGTVAMEVSQTADDLLRFEQLAPNLQLPVVSKRLAEATVYISDGETVVLGGLMSDRVTITESGIPILKDIPLLGNLFRSRDTRKEKNELLVFLTPQVVRAPEESRMITEQQRQMMRNLPGAPPREKAPQSSEAQQQ